MKTASMVLGIVGGVMAIVIAIVFVVAGCIMLAIDNNIDVDAYVEKSGFAFDSHGFFSRDIGGLTQFAFSKIAVLFVIAGAISFIGGVLGLIGGAIVKKKNKVAGILLIIAAVINTSAIFTLGAIFALIPEKKAQP